MKKKRGKFYKGNRFGFERIRKFRYKYDQKDRTKKNIKIIKKLRIRYNV
jgi:hypothetical protein